MHTEELDWSVIIADFLSADQSVATKLTKAGNVLLQDPLTSKTFLITVVEV